MARKDVYGDKGPKKDRPALEREAPSSSIGSRMGVNRADGSKAAYVRTVAGFRMVPGSETKPTVK